MRRRTVSCGLPGSLPAKLPRTLSKLLEALPGRSRRANKVDSTFATALMDDFEMVGRLEFSRSTAARSTYGR